VFRTPGFFMERVTVKTHDRYIERAILVASTSEYRWQLGSVIVNNGNVLSSATNRFRNPPTINYLHATYHAEMAALRRCLLLR
jgi:tRNA(Arg) A34 adenosine deaminase TadA